MPSDAKALKVLAGSRRSVKEELLVGARSSHARIRLFKDQQIYFGTPVVSIELAIAAATHSGQSERI